MSLTQETFLGASVRSFNANVGWGTQSSVLTVELVEDPSNGDSFSPPTIGSPVYFDYQGWGFGGLLQNYKQSYGQQGNPVFSVQIEDPRQLLEGVQLILQDYTGSTYGVSNLYNIYGYLESTYGFGGSQSNETGVPWKLIRDAFYQLQLSQPISFRGYNFFCAPFYGMNLLPDYYRIGGDSISLLDFISNICETTGYDFSINMVQYYTFTSPVSNAIIPNLVSRRSPLRTGVIDEFVTQVGGAVAKQQGYELRNETTSKFVVGGQLCNLYFQNQDNYDNNYDEETKRNEWTGQLKTKRTWKDEEKHYYDDIIIPYWGHDCFDRLIIGTGNFHSHDGSHYRFRIDGRPLYQVTGNNGLVNYETDLNEIHAALQGQETWEAFISIVSQIPDSIHYEKADKIGLPTGINNNFGAFLSDAIGRRTLASMKPADMFNTARATSKAQAFADKRDGARIKSVYNYINKFATEYYGKKFMVRIPFVLAKRESETNRLVFSVEPTESGYVDEDNWGVASVLGLMPRNPEKFTTQENKIYPFAKFVEKSDEMEWKDEKDNRWKWGLPSSFQFDRLSPDSYILDQKADLKAGEMYENLFVKCTMDPNLVFLNSVTLFSPRVVVTLDAPVYENVGAGNAYNTMLLDIAKRYLTDPTNFFTRHPTLGAADLTAWENNVDLWADRIMRTPGMDYIWKNREANAQMPDMIAIALKSNILRYGPWYIQNKAGKVEFQNDSTLVPWNYGGFEIMNLAGWSKVEDALSGQQIGETGSVEFPGAPSVQIGAALRSGGPIVTDVTVDVGEGGVTTTYRMGTWSYQFGRLSKYNADRFQRMSQILQDQRKAFRRLYGYREPSQFISYELDGINPIKPVYHTSEPFIMGSIIYDEDTGKVRNNIVIGGDEILNTIDNESYKDLAGTSLESIFATYSTEPSGEAPSGDLTYTMRHSRFEIAASGAASPTAQDLLPYGDDNVSLVFPEQSGVPNDLSTFYSSYNGHIRGVGLKAPVVVVGYGYDTDGNPVPSGGNGEYVENYRNRADLWKAGPIDLRWDNSRKVWSTGSTGTGTANIKVGVLDDSLFSSGDANVTLPDGTTVENVKDWLLLEGNAIQRGTNVIIGQVGSIWYVLGAKPGC